MKNIEETILKLFKFYNKETENPFDKTSEKGLFWSFEKMFYEKLERDIKNNPKDVFILSGKEYNENEKGLQNKIYDYMSLMYSKWFSYENKDGAKLYSVL